MSATEWRERLLDRMPPDLAEEIDIFEGQMELRRRGAVEDRVFAETRLRRTVTVLKSRASGHDQEVREFEITSDGIVLGQSIPSL